MKFMLMILNDEAVELALPPAEIEALVARHGELGRALRAAGRAVAAHRLRPTAEAATIRYRGDSYVVLDGPFAETKEALGGFYLIESDTMGEAIEWAKRLPLSEASAVEVRPARTGAQWHGATRGAPYVVMFIGSTEQPLSRDAIFRAIDNHYELSLTLAAQGKFVGSRALEPPTTATTLRWRAGERVITDGPFVETKEFVAGYFVIASESRAEAIEWAAQLGRGSAAVEVRPVWQP